MSEVTITLPAPSIPKPLPPPIVTSAPREGQKDRLKHPRQRFSPPTLPPPAPPTTITSPPPPYSSLLPPTNIPSSASPLSSTQPQIASRSTPPARPPPPSFAPPSVPPRPLPPVTCSTPSSSRPSSHVQESSEPQNSNQNVVLEDNGAAVSIVEGGGGDGEGVTSDGRRTSEPHYERAPVSQGGAGLLSDGEEGNSGPDYANIESLEEDEEDEGRQHYSNVRQNYQNWDILGESDSDDDDNPTPHSSHHHHPTQSNPPTLHFNTHPVLMGKKSGGSKQNRGRGKPRNRAPPPPPGVKSQGGDKIGGDVNSKEEGKTSEESGEQEPEEHDYSTIRHSDYINWEYEGDSESDEDTNNGTPKPRLAKRSNPPTLPLNTHPVLMRSQSQDDIGNSPDDTDGKRPKNRAPPPPPMKSKSKPPRGLSHQFSQQLGSDSAAKESGEYARVSKPHGLKRSTSDQPDNDKNKQQQMLKQIQESKQPLQQKHPQQTKVSRSGLHPNQQSPLAKHKNGETTPPLAQGGKSSASAKTGEKDVVGRSGGGIRAEGGAVRPPRVVAGRKRHSATELEEEGQRREPLQSNIRRKESGAGGSSEGQQYARPKRQAPPPPPPPPTGRADQCTEEISRGSPEETATSREPPQGAEALPAERQTPPPKPKRLHRKTTEGISTEASPTTQESTETERQTPSPRAENGQGMNRWERLLHKMEFFTLDLIKEGDRSLGMVIVSGKVRNKDGSTVEGIFIQKILPGSLTDKDGRIQAGDMLVEINGMSMVGATVDLASRNLRDSKDSVKLKVGRPDRGAFKVPGDDKDLLYANSDKLEDSEFQAKLEEAEARAAKMEELRNKAEKDLKVFREMADNEQKNFHKKLEEREEKHEAYKKETQAKISDLTIALANITVEKTKLEKEVESLKSSEASDQDSEISLLKRQLKESESEREMAEKDLQQLRQEIKGNAGLQSRLSELDSDLAHVQEERDAVRRQLESTCHELSVAHATLEQMQMEKKVLEEENERVTLELERERKPSTGRSGVEAELSQKKKELLVVQREVQTLRGDKERLEKDMAEGRKELDKEKEKNVELEKKLESLKKAEKTGMSDLLNRLQTKAQEIHNLKKELSEVRSQASAGGVAVVKEDQPQHACTEEEREVEDTEPEIKVEGVAGKPMEATPVEDKPESSLTNIKRSKSPVQFEPQPAVLPKADKSIAGKNKSPSTKPSKDKHSINTEESISIDAFDDIKPSGVLDNTHAKDKSQAALRRPRNRPSREHIRSMSAENLLSGPFLDENSELSPTEKVPVPRPRKHTLEKDSQPPKPQPSPRHLRSPLPLPNDRPPKPMDTEKSPDRKARAPKSEPRSGRMSPPHTRAPSPKPQLPSSIPPKPIPRRNRRTEDIQGDDIQTKDPSQLSVKERMELAQKAIRKPPPVFPKKPPSGRTHADTDLFGPKSLSQPEGDESELPEMRYTSENDPSPRHVKKLPPGAFNIGLLGMTPYGARPRSHTVATSREHSMERENAEEYRELMQKEAAADIDISSTEPLETDDAEVKAPPKRPPLPLTKRTSSNEKPNYELPNDPPPHSVTTEALDETDDGDSSVLLAAEHGTLPNPSELDFDQVLTWSPAQVASWINRIGISQYAKSFLDKGLQGNKLFDLDGGALKAMGVNSPDDRALIKREIKALRPHAEKQKKVLKKEKDDKKKKKRHFV